MAVDGTVYAKELLVELDESCLRETCRRIEEKLSEAVDQLTAVVGPVPTNQEAKAVDVHCQLEDLQNRLCMISAQASRVVDLARAINKCI